MISLFTYGERFANLFVSEFHRTDEFSRVENTQEIRNIYPVILISTIDIPPNKHPFIP